MTKSSLLSVTVASFALALSIPAVGASAQETIELTLWSRADASGPLRPGNILEGANRLNAQLEMDGADYRVAITVNEQPDQGGYDSDAERLLRAYAIGEGPDIFHAAHEWICAFAEPGYLFDLTDFTNENPQFFGDIFPSLWKSTECVGRRFAVPQDAEARMFFFNKGLMRAAGFSDEEIESLDERVLAGEVTLDGIADIAQQIVENTDAEYGILHRPSRGPDYLMIFNQYGSSFVDPETGKLLLEESKIADAYGWFERNVQNGVTPSNNTSMDWSFIRDQFYRDNNAAMWMYGVWDLGSNAFPRGVPSDKEGFFELFGWTAAPAPVEGGRPGSLTHPIVYGVGAGEHQEIAATIVGYASDAELNTNHAVTTTHIGIKQSQLEDPRYAAEWSLALATELLEFSHYMPNHPDFGALNQIIYEALQGVETGQISAAEAAAYVLDEADARIPDSIVMN
ncbi:MAG: extracellular solute-binding protein [Albidovulum sp.]|nr:extracellular solute-binding protein [Albidovulum sp.]MDE0531617.1 extracellular solute-binding protein [Albidovulum sp.]